MHVKVGVIHVQGDLGSFASDSREQRFADIEIQRVAEFVLFRSAGGFNPGGQIARVMPAEAGLTQGTEQVFQSLESQKIERLVSDFKFDFGLGAAALAALGSLRLLAFLVDGNVTLID